MVPEHCGVVQIWTLFGELRLYSCHSVYIQCIYSVYDVCSVYNTRAI